MRRAFSLVHRWLGGLFGLGLAVLGLSGAALLWKPWWIGVAQERRPATCDEVRAIIASAEQLSAEYVLLPSHELGVAQAGLPGGAGAYLGHDGTVLARWSSAWDRPETFLFDLHHHLLIGKTGELIGGWLGLAATLFCLTGIVLWWPTRRTFRFSAVPSRLTRPAILRHHRDLGVVLAVPILLVATTGALMALRPLREAVLAPLSSPAQVHAWQAKPAAMPDHRAFDWEAIIIAAQARFPDADMRVVSFPDSDDRSVQIRMRQASEWHPNGRTAVSLAGDGTVLMARDAANAPLAVKAGNALYPLHSARMTGSALALPLRIVMTLAGLGLALLGSLAVVTFWRTR